MREGEYGRWVGVVEAAALRGGCEAVRGEVDGAGGGACRTRAGEGGGVEGRGRGELRAELHRSLSEGPEG